MRELKAIQALKRKGDYPALVARADNLLRSHPYSVQLLVLKAQALQLLEDVDTPTPLTEAKRLLALAVTLDPKAVDALNELAFYTFAVEDQTKKALDLFERAMRTSLESFKEAQIGKIQCLLDLDRWSDCERALRDTRRVLGNAPEIAQLEQELRATRQSHKA
ncbi:MAG: hypothetical protein ACE5JL_08660, partial [Dehalococcoidia bacterium]